jgi:hypothetical protein
MTAVNKTNKIDRNPGKEEDTAFGKHSRVPARYTQKA